MSYEWTPENEERLISLWRPGTSAKSIAASLGGGLSGSAVASKVSRLRKAGVDVGSLRTGGPASAARRHPKAPLVCQKGKPALPPDSVQMNPATLLDLKPNQCRFPIDDINEPGTADTLFCGAEQKDGSSYCAHHHARCMTPYKRRKKPLDRSAYIARDKFVFGVAA